MARGAEAKSKIQKQILETFPGSFLYNDGKEIRIPTPEGAEIVQIKVTLTCAKEHGESGADNAMPGDFPTPFKEVTPERTEPIAPTSEEKANVANLLRSLGL